MKFAKLYWMSNDATTIRILQVIGAMNRAGAETILMNLHQAIDRTRVQFDYLVHTQNECDYDADILKLGGNIYRLPTFNVVNTISYRKAARAFFAQHHTHAVVHGHIGSCAPIYLDEARKWGLPTVAHSHAANPGKTVQQRAYKWLSRPVAGIADEFLACSQQAGLDRFGAAVVEGQHFHVMPNGINVDTFACTAQEHLDAKQQLGYEGIPLVCHVGRFSPAKNHAFLLESFALAHRQIPDIRLALVGRGPLEGEVKNQARKLGIDGAVDFLGIRDDVASILKAADVFAFPSTSEGLGMSAIEAQTAGARCILSTGVPSEALIASSTRYLPIDDPQVWAYAICEALDTPNDRSDGARAARAHGFDIHDVATWLTDFYTRMAIRCKQKH